MTVSDLFQLQSQVAVVSGGAGLLGAEFCRTLAEAGASVIVADIDIDAAQSVADSLVRSGYDATPAPVDVTSTNSVSNLVAITLENYHHLDILVNSAALDPKFDPQHFSTNDLARDSGAFENYPLDAWQHALDVNLTGVFLCSQAAVRPMLDQGQGVIINVSSIYGLVAPDQRLYQHPDQPAKYKPVWYAVSKSGILGMTRYLAAYYAGKNIRVNALTPGGVYNGHDEQFVRSYSSRTVLGRMANKNELNGALLFLASEASNYMTGANLVVDGGWTTW